MNTIWGWIGSADRQKELEEAKKRSQAASKGISSVLLDGAAGVDYLFKQAYKYVEAHPREVDQAVDVVVKLVILVEVYKSAVNNPWWTGFGAVAGLVTSKYVQDVASRLYKMHEHLTPASRISIDFTTGYYMQYLSPEIRTTLMGGIAANFIYEETRKRVVN